MAYSRGGGTVSGTERLFRRYLSSALRPIAPEFIPGGRPLPPPRPPTPEPAKLEEKSSAPDLPTRIHEDIANLQYECVICTAEVLPTSKIWTCGACWAVVHLSCVKRWHSGQLEQSRFQQERLQQPEPEPSLAWRCPGCNTITEEEPGRYSCWCGKDDNPKNIPGLPPHSCGQTCGRLPRGGGCPHPCMRQCHAGPCPPCKLMAPARSCFCGRHKSATVCSETQYSSNGWSCGDRCGSRLPCGGGHTCPTPCHDGPCGRCDIPVMARCYCGKVRKEMPCQDQEEWESFDYVDENRNHDGDHDGDPLPPPSQVQQAGQIPTRFVGSFTCDLECGREFDCGKHRCTRGCHPLDRFPAHCPFSPDVRPACACGKTAISELLSSPRRSCVDPIPRCSKVCDNTLICGHRCLEVCHGGSCPPCTQFSDRTCRCGRPFDRVPCKDVESADPAICERACQARLSCGRHQCLVRCCADERRAIKRAIDTRRRNRKAPMGRGQEEEVEAEHICVRICGRPLRCETHTCQQLCHRGACPPCRDAVFEEMSCPCGRTVVLPPQPCGTKAPTCNLCSRRTECGHPVVPHPCHGDDVSCLKCPYLVQKRCLCGKYTLGGQPCWFEETQCGEPCGTKLKCGTHTCQKPCHRFGECEDAGIDGRHCDRPCAKPRRFCEHSCPLQCHAPDPCREDTPCQFKKIITCPCEARKQENLCGACQDNPRPWDGASSLDCDDECLRTQRNRRIAAALNIDPDTHEDDHVPYSDQTLQLFLNIGIAIGQAHEREFRVFADDTAERRLRLRPMPSYQRAFLHSLAKDFGFVSESQDLEPHRHVCVTKPARFGSAPFKTLAQSIKIRSKLQASKSDQGRAGTGIQPPPPPPPLPPPLPPFNALLLSGPRFGLTIDQVEADLAAELSTHPLLAFSTSFQHEEIVIRAAVLASGMSGKPGSVPTGAAIEAALVEIAPKVRHTATRLRLARSVGLCHADACSNVTRREGIVGGSSGSAGPGAAAAVTNGGADPARSGGEWCAVARRAAHRPKSQAHGVGGRIEESSGDDDGKIASAFVRLMRKEKKEAMKAEPKPAEDTIVAPERVGD